MAVEVVLVLAFFGSVSFAATEPRFRRGDGCVVSGTWSARPSVLDFLDGVSSALSGGRGGALSETGPSGETATEMWLLNCIN